MLEESESKESDLIPNREYRKRRMRLLRKHANLLAELLKTGEEGPSWGTIIERNAQTYPDNIAIKFEDTTLTY